MSRAAIAALYDAFARLDGEAMQAAYAENARFDDPVFSLSGRSEIGGMWRMLTENAKAQGVDVWKLDYDVRDDTHAHWEAHYRFSKTRRKVHNVIEARFVFDAHDMIVEHIDTFDFWRWSRQALGPMGLFLGWMPSMREGVRKQARANLDRFLARGR